MTTEELATKFPLANPELRPFLELFPGWDLSVPPSAEGGVRAYLGSFPPPILPDPEVASIGTREIPGFAGQPLRILVLRPPRRTNAPVILAFHGGGFLFGAPELDIPIYSEFVTAGFSVVSVDYRLAPEHPYPAAIDDAEIAYKWVTSPIGQEVLGVDGSRVGLYGSSAGSAIATGLAIRLAGSGVEAAKALKIVVMDSTLADDRVIYPSQASNHPNSPYHLVWTAANSHVMRALAFPTADTGLPIEAAPLRSTNVNDFKALAPHFITSCELDSLADQGNCYNSRLRRAGVDVQFKMWKGGMHAFQTLAPTSTLGLAASGAYTRAFQTYLV